MKGSSLRTCNGCGRVYFPVTRQYAEAEVLNFNAYFDTLSEEKQLDYYGGRKSSVASYEYCWVCANPYTNFRNSQPGDCPEICTLNPIIVE